MAEGSRFADELNKMLMQTSMSVGASLRYF